MGLPDPKPGLVIHYAFLWRDELERRIEEGRKDRPCVIVMTVVRDGEKTIVTVAPITHAPPTELDEAVELPPATKRRLGLDDAASWVVAKELNQFVWPGPDLRPIRRGGAVFVYGLLPAALYGRIRDQVLAMARKRKLALIPRQQ